MRYIILIVLLVMGEGAHYQTGLDNIIKNQPSLSQASNYPIHSYIQIEFNKQFSEYNTKILRVPEVLLMYEQMTFESKLDVDLNLSAGDITTTGFELRYRLGGPAKVYNLKVRWVAFVDATVKLIYNEYSFMQLRELRQGTGIRKDVFKIDYQIKEPIVSAYLIGFKINPENGPYSIQITPQEISDKSCELLIQTRDETHIRYLKIGILIVGNDSKAISKLGGVDAKGFNYFEDKSSSGIRRVEFEMKIPEDYFIRPHENILSQGIRGFDANTTASSLISMSLDNYKIEDEHYTMNFGPMNETVIYNLDFSILLYSAYRERKETSMGRRL